MGKFTSNLMKGFNALDSYFKTENCEYCMYSNVGVGECDTCSNLRFPDKKYAENHHSDFYDSREYERLMNELKEESKYEYEYDWFGLVQRKKLK